VKLYVLIAEGGFLTFEMAIVAAVEIVLFITIDLVAWLMVNCDWFKLLPLICTVVVLLIVTCGGKLMVRRLRMEVSENVIW